MFNYKRGQTKMNKKAQFLIVFAVIFGILILGFAKTTNFMQTNNVAEKQFYNNCQNYKYEVERISHYVLENDLDIKESIRSFTEDFLKSTKVELFYAYGNSDSCFVKNMLKQDIKVNDLSIESGKSKDFIDKSSINIISTDGKIDETVDLKKDNIFYFYMKKEKEGEVYVCEGLS